MNFDQHHITFYATELRGSAKNAHRLVRFFHQTKSMESELYHTLRWNFAVTMLLGPFIYKKRDALHALRPLRNYQAG